MEPNSIFPKSTKPITGKSRQMKDAQMTESQTSQQTQQTSATKGTDLIVAERKRQLHQENWTNDHDDGHKRGELTDAALSYIYASLNGGNLSMEKPPKEWPWDAKWWKPSRDPVRNLTKAGALIAAEIDRLDRSTVTPSLKTLTRPQPDLEHSADLAILAGILRERGFTASYHDIQ